MGPLGELGALFNPGMRHEIEERQAKANRREEEGNARDGDLRIDLASGVAVISLSNGGDHSAAPAGEPHHSESTEEDTADVPPSAQDAASEHSGATSEQAGAHAEQPGVRPHGSQQHNGTQATARAHDEAVPANDMQPVAEAASADGARPPAARGSKPLTAAQARRLATAARRSASGDQPVRTSTPRPANAQLPSSKASRAAR